MKLIELIGRLTEYNPQAEVDVVVHNQPHPFSVTAGGGDGCTKENCDSVSFYVDELNRDEATVIRIQGKLTPEQRELLITATQWVERIANRVPELPVLFMDNITDKEMWALAKKLRGWIDQSP